MNVIYLKGVVIGLCYIYLEDNTFMMGMILKVVWFLQMIKLKQIEYSNICCSAVNL